MKKVIALNKSQKFKVLVDLNVDSKGVLLALLEKEDGSLMGIVNQPCRQFGGKTIIVPGQEIINGYYNRPLDNDEIAGIAAQPKDSFDLIWSRNQLMIIPHLLGGAGWKGDGKRAYGVQDHHIFPQELFTGSLGDLSQDYRERAMQVRNHFTQCGIGIKDKDNQNNIIPLQTPSYVEKAIAAGENVPTNSRSLHTKHEAEYTMKMIDWGLDYFAKNKLNEESKDQFFQAIKDEFYSELKSGELTLGPRAREVQEARDEYNQRSAQEGFSEDNVGGITNSVATIDGLSELFENAFNDTVTFAYPIPSDGLAITFAEIQQIMRELQTAISNDTSLYFSLSNGAIDSNVKFPVIDPSLEHTLTGKTMAYVDFYMKCFWSGKYLEPVDLDAFSKGLISVEDIPKYQKSVKDIFPEYETTQEIADRKGLDRKKVIDGVNVTNHAVRYWINAHQKEIAHCDGLFLIQPDFSVNYEVNPNDRMVAFLTEYERRNGMECPDYVLFKEVQNEVIKQKKELMPQLPFLKKYFQLLGVINYFANFFHTQTKNGAMPKFKPFKIDSSQIVPSKFPQWHDSLERIDGGCTMRSPFDDNSNYSVIEQPSLQAIQNEVVLELLGVESEECKIMSDRSGSKSLVFKLDFTYELGVKKVPLDKAPLVATLSNDYGRFYSMLLHAIRYNNEPLAKNYLKLMGHSANDNDLGGGKTLLHFAEIHNQTGLAETLIQDCKLNPLVNDKAQMNPFLYAISNGNVSHVLWLIERFPKDQLANSIDQYDRSALYIASKKGNLEMVTMLLDNLPTMDVNKANTSGQTPISIAVYEGHENIALEIINKRHAQLDLNKRLNTSEDTMMHFAAKKDMHELISKLCALNIEQLKTDSDELPLHVAAKAGSINALGILIKNSSEEQLNQPIRTGETAVMLAAINGDTAAIKLFCQSSSNINLKNKQGYTSAMLALMNSQFLALSELINHDRIDLWVKNDDDESIIDMVLQIGLINLLDNISSANEQQIYGDSTKRDRFGWHPIHYVIRTDDYFLYERLINRYPGCKAVRTDLSLTHFELALYLGKNNVVSGLILQDNIKIEDIIKIKYNDYNGIQLAARSGHLSIVKDFLAHSGNPNEAIESGHQKGKTLAYIAAESGQLNVLEELLSNGAELQTPYLNRHILYPAITFGNLAIIDMIILKMGEENKDVNQALDNKGTKAGHLIVRLGDRNLLDHMTHRGVRLSVEDRIGVIPYHIALEQNKTSIINYFEAHPELLETSKNEWAAALRSMNYDLISKVIQRDDFSFTRIDSVSKRSNLTLCCDLNSIDLAIFIFRFAHESMTIDLLSKDGRKDSIFSIYMRQKQYSALKNLFDFYHDKINFEQMVQIIEVGIQEDSVDCVQLCMVYLKKNSPEWEFNTSKEKEKWLTAASQQPAMTLMLKDPLEWTRIKTETAELIDDIKGWGNNELNLQQKERLSKVNGYIRDLFTVDTPYLFEYESFIGGKEYYFSLLHLASRRCSFEFAKSLIEQYGYSPNGQDQSGHTISYMMSNSPHIEPHKPLWRLLDWGIISSDGTSPLLNASTNNFSTLVDFLFEEMNDTLPEIVDNNGNTLIHIAAENNKLENVRSFLKQGISPNIKNYKDQTPIMAATRKGKRDMIKLLSLYGANLFEVDPETGDSLIHIAIKNKFHDTALYLIASGIDCTIRNKEKSTILHLAAKHDMPALIPIIIENGVNVLDVDDDGYNAFHYAITQKSKETVMTLLSHDKSLVNVAVCDGDNDTEAPLHLAANSGEIKILQLLIDNGANEMYQDKFYQTYAVSAAKQANLDLFKFVWERMVSKDDGQLNQMVFESARNNKINNIEFLFEENVSVGSISHHGYPPAWIAACNGFNQLLKLIFTCSEPLLFNGSGEHAIETAISNGHLGIVKILLDNDASLINYQTKKGASLLHLAARASNKVLIAYLLKKGVEINSVTHTGNTALHESVIGQNIWVYQLLVIQGANQNELNIAGENAISLLDKVSMQSRIREDWHTVFKKRHKLEGKTPIERAIEINQTYCLDYLFSNYHKQDTEEKVRSLKVVLDADISEDKKFSVLMKVDVVKDMLETAADKSMGAISKFINQKYQQCIEGNIQNIIRKDEMNRRLNIRIGEIVNDRVKAKLTEEPGYFERKHQETQKSIEEIEQQFRSRLFKQIMKEEKAKVK